MLYIFVKTVYWSIFEPFRINYHIPLHYVQYIHYYYDYIITSYALLYAYNIIRAIVAFSFIPFFFIALFCILSVMCSLIHCFVSFVSDSDRNVLISTITFLARQQSAVHPTLIHWWDWVIILNIDSFLFLMSTRWFFFLFFIENLIEWWKKYQKWIISYTQS